MGNCLHGDAMRAPSDSSLELENLRPERKRPIFVSIISYDMSFSLMVVNLRKRFRIASSLI